MKAGIMDYKQLSDQMACELEKTFKNPDKKPPMSLIMKLVKIAGKDKVIQKLGNLRESKNFHEIKDFKPYLIQMIKN